MPQDRGAYVALVSPSLLLLVISLASLMFPVHAAGSPDLTVDSIWLERDSAPGQPVAAIQPGEAFNIVATVKNLGDATAYGYYLDVYYDSEYGRGGPDDMAPGEVQTWFVGPLTGESVTHTTQWVVDPDSQIAEVNELNNEKEYAFTIGSPAVTITRTLTENSTSYLHQTTTVTSYTGTETSTSTVVVPTTVTVAPSTTTSTVQTTQVLTSTGVATVTGYTTTTLTSYTGTETLTSTIPSVTTVRLVPLTVTSTAESTQYLTSILTTTVTSYTATQTSTSTSVVYTTVTASPEGAGAGASSPLAYFGFLSLLAVTAGKGWRIPRSRSRSRMERRCSSS